MNIYKIHNNYNQNKNCTSLRLKNGHGADKTSSVANRIPKKYSTYKKEYLAITID